jgi:hypothetical protein
MPKISRKSEARLFHPEPARDLLVCKPTHEVVKVARQPMIPIGDKAQLTPQAST